MYIMCHINQRNGALDSKIPQNTYVVDRWSAVIIGDTNVVCDFCVLHFSVFFPFTVDLGKLMLFLISFWLEAQENKISVILAFDNNIMKQTRLVLR